MITMSTSRRSRRMSATSEDSTEDLLSKSNEVTPRPSVDSTINDSAYMNYVVELPRSEPSKKWQRLLNKSLVVVIVILLLILIVFMSLYFHERSYRSNGIYQEPKGRSRKKPVQPYFCPNVTKSNITICTTPSCVEASAYMQAAMDKSIDPCEDFYLYSCAGWLSNNPIPDGESLWDTVSVLSKRNVRKLKTILENVTVKSVNDVESMAEFNAYKFYRSCRNMKEIDKLGIQPLLDLLRKTQGFIKPNGKVKYSNLTSMLKDIFNKTMILPVFSISVVRDDKNSTVNIIKIHQSGIGLPQYIYRTNTTDSKKIIKEYIKYNVELGLAIDSNRIKRNELEQIANETFNFERELVKIFVPLEKLTTIDQYYEKTSLKDFQNKFTTVNWKELLNSIFNLVGIEIKAEEPLLFYTMPYFEKLDELLKKTSLRVVQNLATFKLLRHHASFLTEDVIALRKNLTIAQRGTYKKLERWRRCVSSTDSFIGMASGLLFVKSSFAKDSRNQATKMVEDVRNAFIEGFESLEWMDDHTRNAAKDKAEHIVQKIGYPEYIENSQLLDNHYKGLNFSDKTYFKNALDANFWYELHHLQKLRKSVDRTEWYMTPPTVNAYYDPSENEIVFPAGILQPPYFKHDYPKSVNYGMMGAVIGHEITHAFDNNGRLYDKDGNFGESWWTPRAAESFKTRSKCFVAEYSNFTDRKAPKQHIKGNVTLGENIADNGGLKAAYRAYKNYIKQNGEEAALPGLGLTNDQAFFIGFAQSWCTDELTEILIKAINTDSHSPAIERVRGSVQNNDDFARAFHCPVGSEMNPKKKCSIWS